ncbi:MAG: DUF5103 domain-containing protein [Candidatus Kapabacteria bacterium]|nr:DUF5103 domain-containing protein [Candidatus Kapabacteria bacterium]
MAKIIVFIGMAMLLVFRAEAQTDSTTAPDIPLPPLVRFVRVYGGNDETLPPVLLVKQRSQEIFPTYGARTVTIELDVQSPIPPSLYAVVAHCSADWTEDGNVFLNDVTYSRTSDIDWRMSAVQNSYYSYRGKLSLPNQTLKIPYGGNWKVKFYEFGNDTTLYAEARIFAVDCSAECTIDIYNDFYEPTHKASPSALTLEALVGSSISIADIQMNTAVFYRMNRWNEPFVTSQSSSLPTTTGRSSRGGFQTLIGGSAAVGKRFRIMEIPAENDYRILDMTNTAQYPSGTVPVRMPLSDLRRNGTIYYRADDGAMITRGIPMIYDDYVPIEFVLDPENRLPQEDVFVVGSFNNWTPSAEWQMHYNEQDRLYKLRHWVRRARHNYMYATGRINADTRQPENISYEEFEGNNAAAGNTFIAFIYYRDINFGGYDSITAVGAASIFGKR